MSRKDADDAGRGRPPELSIWGDLNPADLTGKIRTLRTLHEHPARQEVPPDHVPLESEDDVDDTWMVGAD